MKKGSFNFKVSGLLSPDKNQKIIFKELFTQLTPHIEELIFSRDELYFSCNNNNVGYLIYEKLLHAGFALIKSEEIPDDKIKISSVVFPLPNQSEIYDVVSFFAENKQIEIISSKDKGLLPLISREDFIIHNPLKCKTCFHETPNELGFCLFCGHEFIITEQLQHYSLKITRIDDVKTMIKLARFLKDITSLNDYQKLLVHLNNLPTIFNFSGYPSQIAELFKILDGYQVTYNLIDTKTFSFDKFIASFVPYGVISLGTLKNAKGFLDPVLSRLAVDTIRSISSESLQIAVSKCLFEAYRIILQVRNSESSNKVMFETIESELNELLTRFIYFIKRADQLIIFINENNPEQVKKEIFILEDKMATSTDILIKKMYEESLELKKKEYEELTGLGKTVETLQSQIISIMTVLSTIRTKVNYIDTFDIQQNKGDFSELNKLKNKLVMKLKAMEEVLS